VSVFRDDVEEDRMAIKEDKFYSLESEDFIGLAILNFRNMVSTRFE